MCSIETHFLSYKPFLILLYSLKEINKQKDTKISIVMKP